MVDYAKFYQEGWAKFRHAVLKAGPLRVVAAGSIVLGSSTLIYKSLQLIVAVRDPKFRRKTIEDI